MAALQAAEAATSSQDSKAHDTVPMPPSLEMNDLPPQVGAEDDTSAGAEQSHQSSSPQIQSEQQQQLQLQPPTRPEVTRNQSVALGPATELPIAPPPPSSSTGPTLSITIMLTTGVRHPYKIDEKYLHARKVEAVTAEGTFDPREISGYKLKELIWTDWRPEWEVRPASPSSIRLIILGRLVEDQKSLKEFPFKFDDTNIVHMTVKPADFLDDDDTAAKGTGKGHSIRGRDDGERGAGCRCVIL